MSWQMMKTLLRAALAQIALAVDPSRDVGFQIIIHDRLPSTVFGPAAGVAQVVPINRGATLTICCFSPEKHRKSTAKPLDLQPIHPVFRLSADIKEHV
ncbi:hypothetical protein ACQR1Y_11670 [Bradyrhizobium sp. HKCCYLRH3099]|uniref:hypothetical protein n=1 Tax=unclassified Bradyrhizobium TaxID=2631580 RepID=UPI003EB6B9C7